jgi:hypothetical protein
MRPPAALPLLALALAACGGETLTVCNLPSASLAATAAGSANTLPIAPSPALSVTVVDSVTGQDLSAGATGAFVAGGSATYADSLRHEFGGGLTAYGPAGRYAVVVQHPGYAAWGMDDVRVRATECSVQTRQLTARLRPGGQP